MVNNMSHVTVHAFTRLNIILLLLRTTNLIQASHLMDCGHIIIQCFSYLREIFPKGIFLALEISLGEVVNAIKKLENH